MIKEDIIYIDIETVPQVYDYQQLDERTKQLWDKKWQYSQDINAQEQYKKAGIFAEFAKIVCIGIGYYQQRQFVLRSISGDDEAVLLQQFFEFLNSKGRLVQLCAHNGKEFDFPFLCRRAIINAIALPEVLQLQGKKPWELKHIDTMELWKFGDYKNYTSLDLLAHVLGIPSPKSDIDGSRVAEVYYLEKDLSRIVSYCLRDVATLASIHARFIGLPVIREEEIIFV